eukprot:7102245-Karenia_brevis.AAC.1
MAVGAPQMQPGSSQTQQEPQCNMTQATGHSRRSPIHTKTYKGKEGIRICTVNITSGYKKVIHW